MYIYHEEFCELQILFADQVSTNKEKIFEPLSIETPLHSRPFIPNSGVLL